MRLGAERGRLALQGVTPLARSASTLISALALSLLGSPARAEVWVLDDSVRLDPVAATVIEARHPGPDGVDGSYGDENPVWSEADRTIRLAAARNEVVAFQVVVEGAPLRSLALEVSDLTGPGTLAAADAVRRYKEWFVEVRRESTFCEGVAMVTSLGPGWYPDALIPLDEPVADGFGQPFDVPDRRNAVPGQRAAAFWVDVLVPEGTDAGTYRGEVRVDREGGTEAIPLELEVWPITLPAESHGGLGSVNYGGLGFDVWHGPAGAAGLVPWYQMAHAHRVELDALWLWPETLPGLWVDWGEWREALRPFLSGSAFTREAGYFGPSVGQPVGRFVLPFESNWPAPHTGWDDPRPTDPAFWQEQLRRCEEVLIEEGWDDIEAHLFVNGVDEPRDLAAYERIQFYGSLIEGAGLVDRDHVRFRLDAGHFKDVGDLVPGWDVDRIFEEVGDVVDVWNENAAPGFIDGAATRERIAAHPDERWWFYTTCSAGEPSVGAPVIEGEALGMRTWGWITFRYELAGAVTWEMDGMRHDHDVRTCWTNPQCSGYGINGDAVLLYLGEAIGLEGEPVASIRLKGMRRGAQDHEYLWLLAEAEGRRDRAEEIAAGLVPMALDDGVTTAGTPGRWVHDPAAYDDARRRIAALLSRAP